MSFYVHVVQAKTIRSRVVAILLSLAHPKSKARNHKNFIVVSHTVVYTQPLTWDQQPSSIYSLTHSTNATLRKEIIVNKL